MIIEETTNAGLIKSVICHPWVYDRITSDKAPKRETWEPPFFDEIYLIGSTSEGETIGCFIAHPQSTVCWEVHVNVLPEMKDFAHVFGHGCIDWMWSETPAKKLVAQIPVIYKDVAIFSETKGFEVEGLNRLSHLKHGELHDQFYMGLVKRGQ